MMHLTDDFRKFMTAEYEMTLEHRGSWAEKVASLLGSKLEIDPISFKGDTLIANIAVPSHTKPDAILAKLQKNHILTSFKMLQKTFEDTVFLIGVKPEDRIIEMVTDCDFELVGPIVVKNDQETYRFATLDVRNAHKRFSQLLGNLEKIQGVSIKEFHSSKTEQAPLLKSLIETEQNRQLVRELILSDYFNPSNAKRPTQFELAKKLGISSGKINQMLRYLEYISFNNLLILKPDLKEFRSLLREIDEEEEAATKTKSAEKGKP